MVREIADRWQQTTDTSAVAPRFRGPWWEWECGVIEPGEVRSSMTHQYAISTFLVVTRHDQGRDYLTFQDSITS